VSSTITAFAPGRVNLIGEHTDYNDGLALPFAISEGIAVTATAIKGTRVQARALDLRAEDSFDLSRPDPVRGWRAFVRGAVAELSEAGVPVPAARIEITGTVPPGSGLASSAALQVALTLALTELSGAPPFDRLELAKLCSRVENHWAGARTGLLDQLASLCGEEDRALRIDFRSLELTQVPLDLGGHQVVALDSGEHRGNAGSEYNRRRAECARACELLGIESLRDATLELAERLPEPLNRRVRHVLGANARVDQAVDALAHRDLARLGRLLDEAHVSLRDNYEVSTPAVEAAVERLKRAGALGARVLGGGFGGYVVGLMPPDARAPMGSLRVRPSAGARTLPD
jgi:galactokinase